MSGACSTFRSKAEHYRALAALTSDEAAHRILLEMAHEAELRASFGEAAAQPMPALRSFS